ncbi:DUF1279 super [Sporothrix curviconia]|uniref:DUF1279 super n=1 Tax=Sporothrix curviconia TaxID=1260050 RepID=A0ABP0CT68_9PEZI
MLRRSVRSLEVLLEQQSPARLLLQLGTATAAQNGVAQASKQLLRRPAARNISNISTHAHPSSSSSSSSSSRFLSSRTQPRRTFHSSRARRTQQEGPKTGAAGEAAGEAGKAGKAGSSSSGSSGSAAAEPLSLNQRIKKLSREYGWTAVGVYFGLSLLDFPFCFLLVRTLGTDRVAAAEEFVVDHVKAIIPESIKERWRKYRAALKENKRESGDAVVEAQEGDGWGVKEAEERNKHEASLATQLALAYAIHKSFIFVRVPLAAAVTPKVVKVLRSWGWKIGKPKPASAAAVKP